MIKKDNIKSLVVALGFALVLCLLLVKIVERPLGSHVYTFGISGKAKGEITILSECEGCEEKQQIEHFTFSGGEQVFYFETDHTDRLWFDFENWIVGQSIEFQGRSYQRGLHIETLPKISSLPGLIMHGADLEGSEFYLRNSEFEFSFTPEPFAVKSTEHYLSKAALYIALFMLFALGFYFFSARVEQIPWLQLIAYGAFAFALGVGLYFSFLGLMSHPNRTEVHLNWSEKPEGVYGIYHLPAPNQLDPIGVFHDPTNSRALPEQLKVEDPFFSFRLKLDSAAPAYHLKSVTLENSLYSKTIPTEDLKDAFPFRQNVKAEMNNDGSALTLKANAGNSYVQLSADSLTTFRVIDRLIYRAHIILSFAFFVFAFYLLILLHRQKRVKGIRDVWFTLIFLALLFLPGSLWLISTPETYFLQEKRPAFTVDSIYQGNLSEVPGNTERYLEDHFGGRSMMIYGTNIYRVLIFKESGPMAPVAVGKDGWYFYRGQGVGDQIKNETQISEGDLKLIEQNLLERKKWLEAHNTDFYIAFAPLKHSVYPEMLPRSLQPVNKPSKMQLLIDHLNKNTDLKVINLQPPLIRAKDENQIYYKSDSHWNQIGAYTGYKTIVQSINEDYPEFGNPKPMTDYTISYVTNYEADLSLQLGLQDVISREQPLVMPIDPGKVREVSSKQYEDVKTKYATISYVNDDPPNDLEVFYFRDSFSNYLNYSLKLHSEESVFFWTHQFPLGAFDHGYPDIVVYEVMERFIDDLKLPNPVEVQKFYSDSIRVETSVDKSEQK
ncbi:alginate O-acetyltransferase AlgX-related protein [Halocola ammonii]